MSASFDAANELRGWANRLILADSSPEARCAELDRVALEIRRLVNGLIASGLDWSDIVAAFCRHPKNGRTMSRDELVETIVLGLCAAIIQSRPEW